MLAAALFAAGCDALVLDVGATPDPLLKATTVTARYMAGEYHGAIDSTLDAPYVVYHFTYVNGVSLWALLLLHDETGNPAYLAQVRASVDKYMLDELYRPHGGDEPIDYLGAMAHATLEYARETGDQDALQVALDAADFFRNNAARTPEGLIAYHSDPKRGRIWADALFMVMPLLAKAGVVLDDDEYHDDVLLQFAGFGERLRDPQVGLYHQGWNWHGEGATPGFWGRANGWVLVAMVEALDAIPATHTGRADLLAAYQELSAALVAHQGNDGAWHQLLDHPESYAELSATGLITYGLARGAQRGWLDNTYAEAARRGYAAMAALITPNGDLENVCPGTGPQASEQAYLDRQPQRNDSHGTGPAMLGIYAGMLTASE